MDVQLQTDLKAYAERLEVLCRAQADEITRLRAQVATLTEGADDAHSVLKRLYLDETQAANARIRAATAALNVEKPSLKPQPAPLELTAEPKPLPLAEVVRLQRARTKALEGLPPGDPKYRDWVWDADQSKWAEQVRRLESSTDGDGNDSAGNDGTDSSSG
jgi:hypothetical protein